MARKTIRRAAPRAAKPLQPRDFVLAGIGAVSLGRKQVIQSYADGVDGVADLRARTEKSVQGAVKSLQTKVTAFSKQAKAETAKLRKQAKAKVGPVQKKVLALATEAKAQAETRLAPVLARLGMKKAPTRRAAAKKKPAAKRPAAKRPVKRARRAA
jgi:hypothetical protein